MQVILLWAKAQFDVLKGATSKLISNDAIQMSHFIHMNYEAEGDNRDLEKMGRTEYLLYKQQFQEKNEFTIIAITGNLTLQEIQGIINKE